MKEQWISFRLDNQRYCTNAMLVREVITYRAPNPIPGAPVDVEGIINVRGDKIALYSGWQLVRHAHGSVNDNGHIILLESDTGLVGVSVDGVDGIIQINPDTIDPASVAQDRAVLGTVHRGEELLTAVNLAAFCEDAMARHEDDE